MKHLAIPRNVIGPALRRIRYEKGLTQEKLAAQIQVRGWNLSREGLSKIEAQKRWVSDFELHFLAMVLGVQMTDLFPKQKAREEVLKFIDRLEKPLE